MTDWKPNPGYMDVPPDTLIFGRLDGETRDDALELKPCRAGGYRWKKFNDGISDLQEYKVAEE